MNRNELDQIIERLDKAKLTTRCFADTNALVVGIERKDLSIQDDRQELVRWERRVLTSEWELGEPVVLEDACVIWQETNAWSFRNDIGRCIGFETLNCVRVDDLTSERVAAIAIDYLLKPPVHVTHWSIPVYQHPSWEVDQVEECIANARQVHVSDAEDASAYAREAIRFHGVQYEWQNKGQAYLRFEGKAEPWLLLYIRYDLGDAMIAIDTVP